MANFGSPDFSGLGQPFTGQVFGPRHSSPNVTGANSPIPPNIGPIPNVPPPGVTGPHMRLFNPMGMAQFSGAQAITGLPWGAGVMPVAGQVPITVPPPQPWLAAASLQPQVQTPVANQNAALQQNEQTDSQKSPAGDDKKHDHKHRHKHKHEHRHDHRHSHHDDKHRERKHHREKRRSTEERTSQDLDEKASRSRHGNDRIADEIYSDSSHDRKRLHSSGSRHREREDKHSHGTVLVDQNRRGDHKSSRGATLIEDRGKTRMKIHSSSAVLLEDGDEITSGRGSSGAVLIEDRDEVISETRSRGAVLKEDRGRKRTEKYSHGAVLMEDRDEVRSERSSRGAVLLEDRDEVRSKRGSHGAVLLEDRGGDYEREREFTPNYDVEDGEIYDEEQYETTYSDDQFIKDDRRELKRSDRWEKDRHKIESRGRQRDDRYDNDFDNRSDVYRDVGNSSREDRRDKWQAGQNSRDNERSGRHNQNRDRNQHRSSRHDHIPHGMHDKSYNDYAKDDFFRPSIEPRRDRNSRYDDFDDDYLSHDGSSHYDQLSRIEEDSRFSDTDSKFGRGSSRSERSGSRRGISGAILREDRDERSPLKEDGEPPRCGAVLIEDGIEADDRFDERRKRQHHSKFSDDWRESRSGTILMENREESWGQKGRRNHTEPVPRHLNKRTDSILHAGHLEKERSVKRDLDTENDKKNYVGDKGCYKRERPDDRKNEKFANRHSSSANLEDQKQKGTASRNVGVEESVEARKGRTGAVLIEDRRNLQREQKFDVSRTGAVLIEDRNENRSFGNGQRGQNTSFRGQGHRALPRTDSRASVTRHSQERSSVTSRSKRSRSSSVSTQEVRQKPDRGSRDREEPEKKKRRVWEPGPNDVSATKCIRSGSPVVQGSDDDLDTEPIAAWVRCSAADLYFTKDPKTGNMVTTKRMRDLEERFDRELVQRAAIVKAFQEPYKRELPRPNWKNKCTGHTHHCGDCDSDSKSTSSSSSSSSSDSESDSEETLIEEMKFKQQNPYRLHSEIWYNDPNELNYGPLCRCSNKAKKFGIRHSIYPGEQPLPQCDLISNNLDKLYHYRITVSPAKNFIISQPTVIMFDGHEYLFEGFSIFSHKPIPKWPECQVIRFNIIYTIHVVEEQVPENFSVQSLDTFTEYLFNEILELVDIDWRGPGGEGHCQRFHVMPRFARPFPENGKELLSMNDVLLYLLKSSKPLLDPSELQNMCELDSENWTKYVDSFRHMVVTCPGKRPSSIRIDQLDRSDCQTKDGVLKMPVIIHHGVRPPQLSYAGDPIYKKKWREYMKFRHLLWSRAKISAKERERLYELESELEKIRLKCTMKREITVAIDSEGFLKTGIRADICQHAMLLPVLFEHLRFHECLSVLEKSIQYQFKDRSLLQLAMTHSSYKINYGTNPDHGRNSLSNCGFRQLEFGDHKVVTQHTRKRGLNVLLRIMAKMGHKEEKRSEIPHNERLEFLGDAVVEFVTSTHLYNMFPQASEGELTLYRGSLVNNSHLSVLANHLRLQDFLLYAHGPDLCHDSNLKHAMANCFEALMGALFLDGGIELADQVFSKTCFPEKDLLDAWTNTPKHPLIADEPNGDRHWIAQSHVLQKLASFEEDIGYEFRHIRLLARAFTQRNVGYNNLTYGHNQRLEFLGDTIMQLITSEYLFKHFPDHHEGHLTLLRSSLVNNKTQATVATELGMPDFVIKANMTKVDEKPQNVSDLKTKEKADLLEALYGALYVDGGLEPCQILTDVCFFPRLEDFILDQEWNDPKSQLQQCCLTLREMNDESPDIPVYKVIRKYGPTNQRRYTVAVYFREKRLAVGTAGSKQQAEMEAAETALKNSKGLFHKTICPPPRSKIKQILKEELREDPKREKSTEGEQN